MIHWRWISLRLVVSKLRSVEPRVLWGLVRKMKTERGHTLKPWSLLPASTTTDMLLSILSKISFKGSVSMTLFLRLKATV